MGKLSGLNQYGHTKWGILPPPLLEKNHFNQFGLCNYTEEEEKEDPEGKKEQ